MHTNLPQVHYWSHSACCLTYTRGWLHKLLKLVLTVFFLKFGYNFHLVTWKDRLVIWNWKLRHSLNVYATVHWSIKRKDLTLKYIYENLFNLSVTVHYSCFKVTCCEKYLIRRSFGKDIFLKTMEQKIIDIPVYTIDNSFGLLFSVCALSCALWFIKGFLQQVEKWEGEMQVFFLKLMNKKQKEEEK